MPGWSQKQKELEQGVRWCLGLCGRILREAECDLKGLSGLSLPGWPGDPISVVWRMGV